MTRCCRFWNGWWRCNWAIESRLLLTLLLLVHHPYRLFVDPAGRRILIVDLESVFRSADGLAVALQPVQVIGLDHPVAHIGWIEFQHAINGLACFFESCGAAQGRQVKVPGKWNIRCEPH